MPLLLLALAALLAGGLAAAVAGERPAAGRVAAISVFTAAVLGLIAAVGPLAGHAPEVLRIPWMLPFGSLALGLDGLSALFVVPILFLGAAAALYGASPAAGTGHGPKTQPAGITWLLYNLLLIGMLLVVTARNGILFLLAWEVMSVASFFLVMRDDDRSDVRRAGWIYLVATHIGTVFLLVMFVLLGHDGASLDFSDITAGIIIGNDGTFAYGAPRYATAIFLLALIGFGTKAGFVPLHTWLPEAHPAAPSHVSALMSGVMIKTGIYGLLRILTFLGAPPPWFGWTFIAVGAVSGIYGVLFALAQHDLKRLLAYHSVENIGIIALGIGTGLLGRSYDMPVVAFLGFAGALLHVCNHALFKGLLFLAGGAVVHAAGTREIDRLGGMLRRMPVTGASFLVGAVAISGLPPLNGFISEALIYLAALTAATAGSGAGAMAGIIVVAALAMIGGLAAACFTKAFGIVFLGEPRSGPAGEAREAPAGMLAAMLILGAACLAIGLGAQLVPRATVEACRVVAGVIPSEIEDPVGRAAALLRGVTLGAAVLIAAVGAMVLLRRALLRRRTVDSGPTWDCGYAAPSARMQYSASSYAQPLVSLFSFAVRSRRHFVPPSGLFPGPTSFETHAPDPVQTAVYEPVFRAAGRLLSRLRPLQGGRIQLYVLYIAVVLLALLAWKIR